MHVGIEGGADRFDDPARESARPPREGSGRPDRAVSSSGPTPSRGRCRRHRSAGCRSRPSRSPPGWCGPARRSAKANCPGASGRRTGRFGSSGAAARSAVVMNGFSAALRQATNRSSAPSFAARRRFAKARTGSSKNITPKREMIMSKLAGSNAWICASAQMKLRRHAPSRSARARAAAIIGSEMSMPMQWPFAPSSRATASVVLPVPQPTSSTGRTRRQLLRRAGPRTA